MEDGRRRAYIKQQMATRKKEGTSPSNLSIKWKPSDKLNRLPKKAKVAVGSTGATLDKAKLPPPLVHGKGKDLMTGQGLVIEKCLILLREDPNYAFNQLLSIIKSDYYEVLGNHSTKAM